MLKKNTDPENRQINPVFKGFNAPPPQFSRFPYPEPVYTGWSSVHWNATGWPSVHWDTTERPSEYLQGTLEDHWKNLVETAHTRMPLEKL